jgi:hypothetical protein
MAQSFDFVEWVRAVSCVERRGANRCHEWLCSNAAKLKQIKNEIVARRHPRLA